jgi:outer membrane protein assembly factor BamB
MCLMTVIGLVAVGGCAGHRGKSTGHEQPLPIPSNSFAYQWSNDLKLGKDPAAELHLRDATLFLYTAGNQVFALSSSGGELKYESAPDVSGGVLRPPLLLGELVIYPCGSTIIVCNNRGRPVRTIELEKPTRSGAIGQGTTIYLGLDHIGGTGVMASVDITKPYKVINWELMTGNAVASTPAMFDKVIFVGSVDGKLYAVTEERGQVWAFEKGSGTFDTQGKFVSDIKADEFGVYASNTDSKLYCLDRGNGRIKWQYFASSPLKTSPVVTGTMVYQYVPENGIVAIEKTAGEFNRVPKWSVSDAVQVLSEDTAHVYLRGKDNRLMAVDKASGKVVFTSNSGAFTVFATNTRDATIYAAASDGKVRAIRPVLKEGEVGTVVMDFRIEPLALGL